MIKITKLKRSTPGHTHPSLNSATFQPTAPAKDTVLSPSPESSSDSTCKIYTIIYPKIRICFAPSLPKHLSSSYKHPSIPSLSTNYKSSQTGLSASANVLCSLTLS